MAAITVVLVVVGIQAILPKACQRGAGRPNHVTPAVAGDVELNPDPVMHINIPDWIHISLLLLLSLGMKSLNYYLILLKLTVTWILSPLL